MKGQGARYTQNPLQPPSAPSMRLALVHIPRLDLFTEPVQKRLANLQVYTTQFDRQRQEWALIVGHPSLNDISTPGPVPEVSLHDLPL